MKLYQMDLNQVESYLNSRLADGMPSCEPKAGEKKKHKKGEKMIFFHKTVLKHLSFIFWLSLICFGISSVFSALNQNWLLLLSIIGSFLLAFFLFYAEHAILFFEKERLLQRIEKYSHNVSVIRSGKCMVIDKEDLTIGDVLLLEKGTVLHADARVIEGNLLFADEKIVFGKTIPSEKTDMPLLEDNLQPEDQRNMLWKGSYIASGKGKAVVSALENECYIYKTGGRRKKGQRSIIYNRQNNIGRIVSILFAVVGALFALIAALATGLWIESIYIYAVLLALFYLEPVSALTEWNYYRLADKLRRQGAFIRNIEAFDDMNNQKDIYFESERLIDDACKFVKVFNFSCDERTALSYFATCIKEKDGFKGFDQILSKNHLSFEKIKRDLPCFRKGKEAGNYFSLFTDAGASMIASAGYWRGMEQLVGGFKNDVLEQILELERHGKMVYVLATDSLSFIPNQLDYRSLAGKMKLSALVVFDIRVIDETAKMIHRLRRTGMRVHLLNSHSEILGSYIERAYDMDDHSLATPDRSVYSLPAYDAYHPVVYSDSSSIAKEQAKLVVDHGVSPQKIIYQVKCMFCGLTRSLFFFGVLSPLLILSVFFGFLSLNKNDLLKIVLPLLLLQPCVICFCYAMIETVRNCNQTKKSLLFGLLCGAVPLVTTFFGIDMAISTLNLALIIFAFSLLLRAISYRKISKTNWIMLGIGLIVAILPWFLGGNLIASILIALFPALAALIIDFFY